MKCKECPRITGIAKCKKTCSNVKNKFMTNKTERDGMRLLRLLKILLGASRIRRCAQNASLKGKL